MKLLVVVFLFLSFNSFSQVQYEVSKDPENGLKTLKGILSRELLLNDAEFTWMKNDISWYKPNADCVTSPAVPLTKYLNFGLLIRLCQS